jgi:hypothetical protein
VSLAGLEQRARPGSERAEQSPGGRHAPEAGPRPRQLPGPETGRAAAALPLQLLRIVAKGDDPLEREAEELADRVVHGNSPRTPVPGSAPEGSLQRRPAGPGPAPPSPGTAATGTPGGGRPVPGPVRSRIEPHLGASLGQVRVHSGPAAEQAATRLQARAFTHRNQVFLGPRESHTDLRLMAHEATHVVQQAAAGAPGVQRLPATITEGLAFYARYIPGYTLLTAIAGYDPLADKPVEPTPANLVAGLLGLVPAGTLIADKLRELGLLDAAVELIGGQLSRFDLTTDRLERTLEQAWKEMSFARLDPVDYNIGVLTRLFNTLLGDLVGFATSLADQVLTRIKEAALGLAEDLLAGEPAWGLLKKVLHWDPLRSQQVDASTVEILEDFLHLIGRDQELEQMRARGTLQETADWLDTHLSAFLSLTRELGALFSAAWAAIQPANLPNLAADLAALAARAVGFLQRVQDFAFTVTAKVLQLIKHALLGWLSSFAHEVPGFHLLTVIIGRNPFTQEPVPRTAENIIKGFITLLPDGEAQYQQLAETGAIGQAATRIEGALAQLGISWELVRNTFLGIWEGLSIDDLIDPVAAFVRIRDQFGEPISRLFAFVRVVLEELLTLVLQLMHFPSELLARIISNALQAFEDIKKDPVAFLKNMLAAVKAGFSNFFDNILGHLMRGLVEWLFRGLRQAGIEPPKEITLESILGLVLKVLGITVDLLWKKLAARIGQDKVDRIRGAIDKLMGIWAFVRDVQERGVGAVWDYVKTQIGNLWDMVLQKARAWIMEKIVDRVTAKLLSMLDPTGVMAVVNGFIAFFNAVQSAIEYLREILEIIDDYVQTFAAVARGDIEPGAAKLEQGLANAIPVAIGFLANQVGLGNIGDKIADILASLRALVDKALDWLMDQAVRLGMALLRMLGLAGREEGEEVDPSDHEAFARHAAELLRKAMPHGDYESTREAAETFAAEKAPELSAKLPEGTGLSYVFPGERSKEARDLSFSVVIAPNTTTYESKVELEYGARLTVVVGDDDFTLKLDYDSFNIPRAASREQITNALLEKLNFSVDIRPHEARALIEEFAKHGVISKHEVDKLKISHAQAGGKPLEYLQGNLKLGRTSRGAMGIPLSRETRQHLVERGKEEGEQRISLSEYASVFLESYAGQFVSRPSQPRPEPGEQPLLELVFLGEGQPRVRNLGIVRVADDGAIEEIIEINSKEVSSREEFADLMRAAKGWVVRLG